MAKRTVVRGRLLTVMLVLGGSGAFPIAAAAQTDAGAHYVGSAACRGCHEQEYANFLNFAKKAHSFESVRRMRSRLTPAEIDECLECHTTGFRRPGGFRSEEATPDLKNAGCEVCHGPGSRHVASGNRSDIKGNLTLEDCAVCHNEDRIEAFNFKPMIYGGGH